MDSAAQGNRICSTTPPDDGDFFDAAEEEGGPTGGAFVADLTDQGESSGSSGSEPERLDSANVPNVQRAVPAEKERQGCKPLLGMCDVPAVPQDNAAEGRGSAGSIASARERTRRRGGVVPHETDGDRASSAAGTSRVAAGSRGEDRHGAATTAGSAGGRWLSIGTGTGRNGDGPCSGHDDAGTSTAGGIPDGNITAPKGRGLVRDALMGVLDTAGGPCRLWGDWSRREAT